MVTYEQQINDKIARIKELLEKKRERDMKARKEKEKQDKIKEKEFFKVQKECKPLLRKIPRGEEFRVEVKHPNDKFERFDTIYIKRGFISGYEYIHSKDNISRHEKRPFGDPQHRKNTNGLIDLYNVDTNREIESYEALANSIDSVLDQILEYLKQ
jgi:predicted AlkP superfamily phosphohydrolase/phosphomutase